MEKRGNNGRSKAVLDAAAFLNSSFFAYDDAVTTPRVLDEVKSRSAVIDALLRNGELNVITPSKTAVETVKHAARKLGELYKLSETDISVLALAWETGGTLVTDDFHIQNVAEEMGIDYKGITEKIRKKIKWVRKCSRCGRRIPPNYRGTRCPHCGGKIIYSSN